jgi:hypothetical protein
MGAFKSILGSVKIVQNAIATNLTLAASWAAATDIGDLKGKPFVKVTWDQQNVPSQSGPIPLELAAKFETSTLDITTAATLTALKGMRGKNVSLLCTPVGTLSAANPIVIVRNFPLLLSGELNLGDISSIKMSGEKPAYDETDIYTLRATALT